MRLRSAARRFAVVTPVLAAALAMGVVTAPGAHASEPPAAPVNVTATDIGWHQITVEWEHGADEDRWMYRIDNLTNGDVWTVHADATSAVMRGLEPEQTYRLRVRALRVYSSSEPVEVTATTVAMPHVDPPGALEVTGVEWDGATLAWQPSPDPELRRYEIIDVDRGRIFAVSGDTTVRLELRTERTYRFAVRAARPDVDGQPVHSELTNAVSVTTPAQFVAPPDNLRADLDGRAATLTWQRPAGIEFPDAHVDYLVYDGDVLETVVSWTKDATLTHVIPRLSSGVHEFTVRVRYNNPYMFGPGVSAPSNPATVTAPPSGDTTPPNPPTTLRLVVDCDTGAYRHEFLGANDDTSPLEAIQFQSFGYDGRTDQIYVARYDVPRTGVLSFDPSGRFRVVDEAGNLSEIVEELPVDEIIDC